MARREILQRLLAREGTARFALKLLKSAFVKLTPGEQAQIGHNAEGGFYLAFILQRDGEPPGEVCFIAVMSTGYQSSVKSAAVISTAVGVRPETMAARFACGVRSLCAFSRISFSIASQASGLARRYSFTPSRPWMR